MKKFVAFVFVWLLIFPVLAMAAEEPANSGETVILPTLISSTETPAGETTETTQLPEPTHSTTETTTPAYVITIFSYQIIIVPPIQEGEAVSIGLFKVGEGGESEEIATFTVGGIVGKAVSAAARAIAPGVEHGKVVSAYVHKINEERKKVREEAKEEKKKEKEEAKEEKREEKEFRKRERKGETTEIVQEEAETTETVKGKGKIEKESKGKGKGKESGEESESEEETEED